MREDMDSFRETAKTVLALNPHVRKKYETESRFVEFMRHVAETELGDSGSYIATAGFVVFQYPSKQSGEMVRYAAVHSCVYPEILAAVEFQESHKPPTWSIGAGRLILKNGKPAFTINIVTSLTDGSRGISPTAADAIARDIPEWLNSRESV